MLTHPTTDRLREMGLAGMARALEEQRRQPDNADLGFEDRLAMLVDREVLGHLMSALHGTAPVLDPVPESAVFGHAARNGRIALEASPGSAATAVYARLAAALSKGEPLPVAPPLTPAGTE